MPTIYNKIELDGTTLLDLSQDTASSASHIRSGYTAHLNDGTQVTGTYSGSTPTLETVTKTYTPSTSAVTDTITPSSGYDGIEEIDVTVDAIPQAYSQVGYGYQYKTQSNQRKWVLTPYIEEIVGVSGYVPLEAYERIEGSSATFNAIATGTSVTPTESAQTIGGANYMMEGAVTVNAISSSYVGSGITRRSSSDLSASGATVTVPSGYYSAAAQKSVASGSATAPASISGTAASVSTGTNTLTLTKTVSVTPTVSAGYVSSGTAGNSSVSLTASVTTKAAATITPTTTNQTIAAGTYLTGAQTIAGDADLVASNIVSGVQIFGVTGNVVLQNYYTGSSAPSSSLGSNGDLYLQS